MPSSTPNHTASAQALAPPTCMLHCFYVQMGSIKGRKRQKYHHINLDRPRHVFCHIREIHTVRQIKTTPFKETIFQ